MSRFCGEKGVKILIEMWFWSDTMCCSPWAYCELSSDIIGNKLLIGVLLSTNRRSGCFGDWWDDSKGSSYREGEAVTANTGFLACPECTSLAAKLTVQIVLVMNWRTLTWEVAFTVHSISPRPLWRRCLGLFCLWVNSFLLFDPFLRAQRLHPDFFSLTLSVQFRNSCLWPVFYQRIFSRVCSALGKNRATYLWGSMMAKTLI